MKKSYCLKKSENLRIRFIVENTGVVDISICNIVGQPVRTIFSSQVLTAGKYDTIWDGKDEAGRKVATGVYYLKMNFDDRMETKKMLLLQ